MSHEIQEGKTDTRDYKHNKTMYRVHFGLAKAFLLMSQTGVLPGRERVVAVGKEIPLTLTVLDWGENKSVATVLSRVFGLEEEVACFDDVIKEGKKIIAKCKKGLIGGKCCIKRLLFIGHASPGEMSVGDGKKRVAGKYIDSTNVGRLNQLTFCKESEVEFWGCNVAKGEKGREFLQTVANELRVKAIGYTGKVYTLHHKGDKVETLPNE